MLQRGLQVYHTYRACIDKASDFWEARTDDPADLSPEDKTRLDRLKNFARIYSDEFPATSTAPASMAYARYCQLNFVCILTFATRLDTLHIHTPTVERHNVYMMYSSFESLVDQRGREPGFLASMTKIQLQDSYSRIAHGHPRLWCLEDTKILTSFPSLKCVEIHQGDIKRILRSRSQAERERLEAQQTTLPSTETIKLKSVIIQESDLHDLLKPYVNLQHLHVAVKPSPGRLYQAGNKSLNGTLLKVAKSLRSLKLSMIELGRYLATSDFPVRDEVALDVENHPPEGWLTSLPRLHALEHLKIDLVHLFEKAEDLGETPIPSIFPRSLKRLELVETWDPEDEAFATVDYPRALTRFFERLMQACKDGFFPHLKEIVFREDPYSILSSLPHRPTPNSLPSCQGVTVKFAPPKLYPIQR
ncbi:hypothetical protein F5B20DRAFT_586369 [Whalleya microplaca]|nr:hypothetical protein F5B20DRAFT_586369 [Whalleya microplaca]